MKTQTMCSQSECNYTWNYFTLADYVFIITLNRLIFQKEALHAEHYHRHQTQLEDMNCKTKTTNIHLCQAVWFHKESKELLCCSSFLLRNLTMV